jgi:hypothetical protein
MTDAASGVISLLSGSEPKSYATPYALSTAILLALIALPALQLAFVLWSFFPRATERTLLRGTLVPAALNTLLAGALAYAVPRGLFGIPPIEYVVSMPDMGWAALVSVAAAAAWILRATARLLS